MIVKVGDKLYDSNEQPIMLILSKKDKELIMNMAPWATKYCSFPEGSTEEDIKKWMSDL